MKFRIRGLPANGASFHIFFQLFGKTSIVAQVRHFILAAQLADGFHVVDETILFDRVYLQWFKDIT